MLLNQLNSENTNNSNQILDKKQYFNLCNIAINYMIATDNCVKFYEILENIDFNYFEPYQNMEFIENMIKNKYFDIDLDKLNFSNLPIPKEKNYLKICDLIFQYNEINALKYINPLLFLPENREQLYLDTCIKILNKNNYYNFKYIKVEYLPEPITESYKNLCFHYFFKSSNSLQISLSSIQSKYLKLEDYLKIFTEFDGSIRDLDVKNINPEIREQLYLQFCQKRVNKYAYEFAFVKFEYLPKNNAKQHFFDLAQQAVNKIKNNFPIEYDTIDRIFLHIKQEYLPNKESYTQLYKLAYD